jgi:ribose 5-phosphate isomerase A
MDLSKEKALAASHAINFVEDGMILGLGSGSTAELAIKEIGKLVADGLDLYGIASSVATEKLAWKYGIPLLNLDEAERIDLTIDGADEFDPYMQLIKGGGGALLREKILAFNTEVNLIIADSSKEVQRLGAFPLPVEVVPFALSVVVEALEDGGLDPVLREISGDAYITENGNYILDMDISSIGNLMRLEDELKHIPGVVETGLFLDTTDIIIVARGEEVEVIEAVS